MIRYYSLVALRLLVSLAVCELCVGGRDAEAEAKPRTSVQLELHEDIPFVRVQINGSEPLWFNVDSGAGACVIDKATAKLLNIPSEGELQGTGAGAGPVPYFLARNVSFAFAGLSFTPDQVRVIDLSGVSTPEDRKLAGILGYDFSGGMKAGGGLLKYFTVLFDYPSARMILDPNRLYSE